ncbi:hypothetical protein M758_2G231600 [Ceratodon purpureus]|uniref:Uncharacterized protein n=1 Tax=Ceratodon purpureus TaxID=3225 RepID=A0A8T0J204_CERPU|nr:hypothetical protein KC19_2G277600 [Ceratodon purpureus]KAG0627838.1 hypothetical protein M758_2G231600 [Ceratodon purpureus]
MAMSASASCTQTVSKLVSSTADQKVSTSGHPQGVIPLPAKPSFEGAGLRRKKSVKPVKSTKVNAGAREASVDQSLESAVSQAVSKVGEEIAATSGEILDAVDSVIEDGPAGMQRRRNGKVNSRTSRRRALVMCLALGMVRPCASNVASNLQQGNDLRRTVSEAIQSTASSSFQVPATLVSQVSLATAMKQTNFMGEQEDLQKLTTLQ